MPFCITTDHFWLYSYIEWKVCGKMNFERRGFSKDGKTAETQTIFRLLVCENGYPLAYNIFNGEQYESYTMIPVIDDFKQRFGLDDFVVVTDSGFMIRRNIDLLHSDNYNFIIGARIRKYSDKVKDWILSLPHEDGLFTNIGLTMESV